MAASPRRDNGSGLGIAMNANNSHSRSSTPSQSSHKLRKPQSHSDLLFRYTNPAPAAQYLSPRVHKYSQLGGEDEYDRRQHHGPPKNHLAPFVPSPTGFNPGKLGSPSRYPIEARPHVGSQFSDLEPGPSRPVSLNFDIGRSMTSPYDRVVRQSHFSPPTPPATGSGDRKSALMSLTKNEPNVNHLGHGLGHSRHFSGADLSTYSAMTPGAASAVFPPRPGGNRGRALSEGTAQLHRQGTLLTPMASAKRSSAELGIILGTSNMKASKSKLLPQGDLPIEEKLAKLDQVKLEAKKGNKARVEVDVILERDVLVEGGDLRGRLEVRVRRAKAGEGKVWIGGGKMRVVGFEDVPRGGGRHIFYHYPYILPVFAPFWTPEVQSCSLFASEANDEGHRVAAEGTHSIPFSFRLPSGGGAKGPWSGDGKAAQVRYVVVGSIKLHIPEKKKRAIAHFYRPAVVYPYISPSLFHAPTHRPVEASTVKGLGWSLGGDKGQVTLQARLSRPTWVAGQKVWVEVSVANGCNRNIHSLTTTLLRDVTHFNPIADRRHVFSWRSEATNNEGSAHRLPQVDGFQPYSTRKKLCEEGMEASFGAGAGYVGSRGWWSGVESGMQATFECSLNLPPECLSVPRSRLLSVTYVLRVKLNGSISVDLPINIINFISIDPPPSFGLSLSSGHLSASSLQEVPQMSPMARLPLPASANGGMNLDSLRSHFEQIQSTDVTPNPNRLSFPVHLRQRPLSMQSARTATSNPETYIWFTGQSQPRDGGRPLSGHSSLHKSRSASTLRQTHNRRDTSMSYLSAVASEEEDLRLAEAHRRVGRQRSLAAIMRETEEEKAADDRIIIQEALEQGTQEPSEEDTPSEAFDLEATPRTGMSASPMVPDVQEAMEDLDRISEVHEQAQENMTIDDGDADSRHLEEELSGCGYYSRFGNREEQELDGRPAPLLRPGQLAAEVPSASVSTASHSSYGPESPEEVQPSTLEHQGNQSPSVDEHEQQVISPIDFETDGDSLYARERHVARTRSVFGSFAESEVGVIHQAERRDVASRRAMPPHLQMVDGSTTRKGSVPVFSTSGNRHLEVPRSHSVGATVDMSKRRPSAPALSSPAGRRPSTSMTSNYKVPTSPGVHSLNGDRAIRKKASFTFATPTKPIKTKEIDGNPPSPRSIPNPPRMLPKSPLVAPIAAHVKPRTSTAHTKPPASPTHAVLRGMERSPGLAPSLDSESSHSTSRASTPDYFEAMQKRVSEIGEDIARQDTSSPIRVRQGSAIERMRTPERGGQSTQAWTPPAKDGRTDSFSQPGDGSPRRMPLSGPRVRTASNTPSMSSPPPSSPGRMGGPRALPTIPSSQTTKTTPTQRRSYTAKLGPRPLPSPARSSSIISHASSGGHGLSSPGQGLHRKASANSVTSVSTTATTIEAALMKHRTFVGGWEGELLL